MLGAYEDDQKKNISKTILFIKLYLRYTLENIQIKYSKNNLHDYRTFLPTSTTVFRSRSEIKNTKGLLTVNGVSTRACTGTASTAKIQHKQLN